MAYIGTSPQNGVRNRFVYASTQGQTAFTGADADNKTLVVSDQLYTDVYQNGVKLKLTTDWTASSTTVTLVNAASVDDVIEIVSFDVFSVSDTVPASTGGTFNGGIGATTGTFSGAISTIAGTITTASNEEDALLIEQADGTDVGSLRINNGSFIIKGKNASSPVQIQTHDGNEDIEVDPDGFIKMETAGSERMRIDSSGNVLISCTSTMDFGASDAAGVVIEASDSIAASRSGQATLWLKRFGSDGAIVNFYKSTSAVGSISVNGSATAYNTSSDYRLKENVDYTWDATTRLKQLKPARFNFIADDTNTLVDGFLAHEVSSIVPEAITGTKDEVDDNGDAVMQGIDQSKLVPLLVKALQEQQVVIESLTTRITALEAE